MAKLKKNEGESNCSWIRVKNLVAWSTLFYFHLTLYFMIFTLGGDSKTLMITQVAPVRKNEGETICSLNFAQRVRNVELGAATRRLENGDMGEVGTKCC